MTRGLDLLCALVGLVLLSPLLLFIAVCVRVALGAPVLFRQERAGRDGRPFVLVKFRTMSDRRDLAGELLSDEQRLNRFGRFLRAASLDELPELWNVLVGEMSLVGPRPLLMEYNALYSPRQARRLEVSPGITGWAQVNGRNALSWNQRFALDVWYVQHRSFCLNLRILLMTLVRVVAADGIHEAGSSTMSRFRGSSAGRNDRS